MQSQLPIPAHFDPARVSQFWRVPYQERAGQAEAWARKHGIEPSAGDSFKVWLLLVDVQNTFCLPDFELFVSGRSGNAAVEDNQRLSAFIYHNLGMITHVTATMDTHQAMQIFHALFLVDEHGGHPDPYTLVTTEDVRSGRWRFNAEIAPALGVDAAYGQELLGYYVEQLEKTGKYELTIWPYHAMLGGIGHALVSSIEEAVFFHSVARRAQPDFVIKGDHPFTENYSAIGPEVTRGSRGEVLGNKDESFVERLSQFDALVVAGQAKSHCVAWTVSDLLDEIQARDPALARKVYLLEDCTSPVVVPGLDYTDQANAAFARFEAAGMHRVRSTEPFLAQNVG